MKKKQKKVSQAPSKRKQSSRDTRWLLFVTLFFLIVLPILFFAFQSQKALFTKAQQAPATLFFSAEAGADENEKLVKLNLDATNAITFVRAVIVFDKDKVEIATDPVFTDKLKTVVQTTPRATANTTGRYDFSLGLSTQDKANPPTGQFEVIRFRVKAKNSEVQNASFGIDQSNSQVVDIQAKTLSLNSATYALVFRGAAPSITPIPTGVPNPPAWWSMIPEKLRNFLELIYIWVFHFGKFSSFTHLLEGVVPTPTPKP